jgi:hypothetical protein
MDIYNWDMVCAITCRELNKKLNVSVSDSFGAFSWTDGVGNQISGSFDRWEIVPGGSSQRINIITPLSAGRLKASVLGTEVDVAVDGLCPLLQVELAFVNAGNNNNDTHLTFNFAQVSSRNAVVRAGEGSVVVLEADTNQLFPGDDAIIPQLFCQLMAEMLVAMRDKFEFIFAQLLTIPDDSGVSWMSLHRLGYAYNEKISGELGSLAVLGISENNPHPPHPDELQLIFDSSLIRESGSIGFMLSRHMFMENIVLPGLIDVFQGSDIRQFLLDENDVIRNNGLISLNKLNGYTPYFSSLEVKVVDNRIVINNTYGTCDVVPRSSYVSFDLSAIYAPRLSAKAGQYRLILDSVNEPVFNSEGHDTAAKIFWIFGGWVVDALIQGICSQMSSLLFRFGHEIDFSIQPVIFNTDEDYSESGLAGNFYMRN